MRPAHVPITIPSLTQDFNSSANPLCPRNKLMVVLSSPGMTSPTRSFSWPGSLTSTMWTRAHILAAWLLSLSSILLCSIKAPCNARTPTRTVLLKISTIDIINTRFVFIDFWSTRFFTLHYDVMPLWSLKELFIAPHGGRSRLYVTYLSSWVPMADQCINSKYL